MTRFTIPYIIACFAVIPAAITSILEMAKDARISAARQEGHERIWPIVTRVLFVRFEHPFVRRKLGKIRVAPKIAVNHRQVQAVGAGDVF